MSVMRCGRTTAHREIWYLHGLGTELYRSGETYLDFLSGIAVTAFGHSHRI